MKEVLQKINNNILNKILLNYLKIQDIELKNDIVNFHFIKNMFIGEYSMLFTAYTDNPYDFIFYDIFSFFNDFAPKFMTLSDNFYKKWRRNILFQNKSDFEIQEYIKKVFMKKTHSQKCNILLTLLTPGERIQCFFTCMLHYFG